MRLLRRPRWDLLAMTLGIFLAGCAHARFAPLWNSSASSITITPPLSQVPLGERLEYRVSWWGVKVGTAVLTVSPAPEREWIKLACQARSNWVLETFYPVRVNLTSFIDPGTTAPQRFEGYVKRQWRVHESVIAFDWEKNQALYHLPERKDVSVEIAPGTQDGLSMLYHVRMIPFQLGATVPLVITADGENWTLNGQIVRAGMVKIGDLGEYPAVEGQVELAYPVPFFYGAQARVWFSADGQRVPLMAKIRSRIGPVTVVLVRYSNGLSQPTPPGTLRNLQPIHNSGLEENLARALGRPEAAGLEEGPHSQRELFPSVEVIHPEVLRGFDPRGILWDFDNTLWLHGSPFDGELQIIANWFGVDFSDPEVSSRLRESFLKTDGMRWDERREVLMKEGWKVPSPRRWEKMTQASRREFHRQVRLQRRADPQYLVPGSREMLAALHQAGMRQWVVTGSTAQTQGQYARQLGMRDYFEQIHGGGHKAEAIAQALQDWGLSPHQVALISDGAGDIAIAKQAGILAIGFSATLQAREKLIQAGADVVIREDYRDLKTILQTLKVKPSAQPNDAEVMKKLRQQLMTHPYPGGPIQMIVDEFIQRKADIVVVNDPGEGEFLEALVSQLARTAGLKKLLIQRHPDVVHDLMGWMKKWQGSDNRDFWDYLRENDPDVLVSGRVSMILPRHLFPAVRAASERGVEVSGFDPAEYLDLQSRWVGDPSLPRFGAETEERMKAAVVTRFFENPAGPMLVIADPGHVVKTPELRRMGFLLGNVPGLKVITVMVGKGGDSSEGYRLLDQTRLPMAAVADTKQDPLHRLQILEATPWVFNNPMQPAESPQKPVPVYAGHVDRLIYWRDERAVSKYVQSFVTRRPNEIAYQIGLPFIKALLLVRRYRPNSFVLHDFSRGAGTNAEAFELRQPMKVFKAVAAELLGSYGHLQRLYDVSILRDGNGRWHSASFLRAEVASYAASSRGGLEESSEGLEKVLREENKSRQTIGGSV